MVRAVQDWLLGHHTGHMSLAGHDWSVVTWGLVKNGEVTREFELRPGEPSDIGDSDDDLARARRFRDVLGWYASGVTVVTADPGSHPVGLTCQTFSSVSLEPPLVSFMPARTSRSLPIIRDAGHFCVNILAADQQAIAQVFASKGADKFNGLGWAPGVTGAPVLDGAIGRVDCTVHSIHEAGDHFIVVGNVKDLAITREAEPLIYFRGTFR